MNTPTVTCLMTVYNGMPYLRETVETILAQTFSDLHFIIINNGSTDGTADYLESVKDKRVSVRFEPKDVGRTTALNKGLETVETEFTAIIDADDLAGPRRLERQVAFLRDNPGIAMVGSDIFYINRESEVIGGQRYPAEHEVLVERLPLYNQFAHSACTFRTEAARAVGGYPEEYAYAQDFGLWLALLHNGYKLASIPEYLTSIRVHPTQTSRDAAWSERRIEDELRLDQSLIDLPELPKWSRQAARLRKAFVLRSLERDHEAKEEFCRGVKENPFFFLNPILWRRLLLSFKRFFFPLRVT